MSAPTRFLVLAVFSWIGIRASAGMLDLPAPAAAAAAASAQMVQPVGWEAATPWSGPPTTAAAPAAAYGHPLAAAYAGYGAPYPVGPGAAAPRYAQPPAPVYYPYPVYPAAAVAMSHGPQSVPAWFEPPAPLNFDGFGQVEETPLSRLALAAPPHAQSAPPSFTGKVRSGPDRLSLSSWAFVRQERPQLADLLDPAGPAGQAPLASGGTLGGSQAGVRLTWRPTSSLAVNLRASAPLRQGQQQMSGEAALGVSWQPLRTVPVRLMAERRKAIGAPGGGRDAFALLGEGGVYGRTLPWQFRLDGYGQAGVVGARSRDWFVDGGVTATRPVYGRFALGGGVWGGAQPGLSRLDIGPRLSMQVRPGIRTHLDYRYRLLGRSEPGSGFAATVATDF